RGLIRRLDDAARRGVFDGPDGARRAARTRSVLPRPALRRRVLVLARERGREVAARGRRNRSTVAGRPAFLEAGPLRGERCARARAVGRISVAGSADSARPRRLRLRRSFVCLAPPALYGIA